MGAAVVLAAQAAEGRAARPNIILFLVDDMGWMDSTPYGSKYYETPSMERLAAQSMRFTDAYALPLCSPTRASILSGQYSSRHGVTSASGHQPPQPPGYSFLPTKAPPNRPLLMPESKNFLDPAQYTLAEALRDAGYRTAHIGKWHLGLTRPHWPEQQGFDVAFHCHPDPGPPGNYFSPYGVSAEDEPGGKTRVGTITDGPPGEYITDRLTDEALKFIRDNRERPFFLNLWHYGVHGPWGHKEAYTREFARKTDPTGRQGNPIMASMLKSVDDSLGRILDQLDTLKLAENTLLIFTSDNGGNVHSLTEEDAKTQKRKADDPQLRDWRQWAGNRPPTSNAPLRDGKGRLYEGGIRVPLMVRWPGHIPPGTTTAAVVGPIDIYPTVLDLLGLAAPARQKLDGVSYAPVLRQSGSLARDAYFTWFPHLAPGVAVRQGDWKLIRRFEPRPQDYEGLHELFNLREDLGETKNLAALRPEKVRELDALIDAFIKETGALMPRPNPAYQGPAPENRRAADPLNGWVPKNCRGELRQGALVVLAEGRSPFLGIANLKHQGPVTCKFRSRGASGAGKIQWRVAGQQTFPAEGQVANFTLEKELDWRETMVELPVKGALVHLRLYLPATPEQPVELDWVELRPADGRAQRWDFNSR